MYNTASLYVCFCLFLGELYGDLRVRNAVGLEMVCHQMYQGGDDCQALPWAFGLSGVRFTAPARIAREQAREEID